MRTIVDVGITKNLNGWAVWRKHYLKVLLACGNHRAVYEAVDEEAYQRNAQHQVFGQFSIDSRIYIR